MFIQLKFMSTVKYKIYKNIFFNFQAPLKFRCQLTMLLMEIHKISITEFEQVFSILIETIINIIANRMREVSI